MIEKNMEISLCTLFEGHYHFGLAALANSLYKHKYRGVLWAGYRGKLPPWATNIQKSELYTEFKVAEGFVIRFVLLDTKVHLTNYKPTWMLSVLNKLDIKCQAICYFDPDITLNYNWEFFEMWVQSGIALCCDMDCLYPSDHPFRKRWEDFIIENGYKVSKKLDNYFNGGFIGIKRDYNSFLTTWQLFMDAAEKKGMGLDNLKASNMAHIFRNKDQDVLNISAMATDLPLSTIGPEGMGVVPGAFVVMFHSLMSPKPWKKNMTINALKGSPLRRADREFYKYTQDPIKLYTDQYMFWKKLDIKIASIIQRFIPRRW